MKKLAILVIAVAVMLVAGNVMALPVDFGDGGAALQGVFDTFTVGGPSSVNVASDYLDDEIDSYWKQTAAGTSAVTMIVEFAAYAGTNKFGVYDSDDADTKVELFDGLDSPGMLNGGYTAFSILNTGEVFVNFAPTGVTFSTSSFGFYLDSSGGDSGGVFYSNTSLNTDGFDHMAAYQGTGDTVQIVDNPPLTWDDNEYILAWEDLLNGGDKDFTDFVVMVESVEPLPEPGTLLLLGAGLVALVGLRKRMK